MATKAHRIRVDGSDRRVRGYRDGSLLVDAARPRLVYRSDRHPEYWFEADAVCWSHFDMGDTEANELGTVQWFTADDERVAMTVTESAGGADDLAGLVWIDWSAASSWFEEDEQIYFHARDPYRRVDVLDSSRHVEVTIGGITIADSLRPRVVFETALPSRFYVPMTDVDQSLLRPSPQVTGCQYKGETTYWHVDVAGTVHENVAWSYPSPVASVTKLAGMVCFDGPGVQTCVDGDPVTMPEFDPSWLNPSMAFG